MKNHVLRILPVCIEGLHGRRESTSQMRLLSCSASSRWGQHTTDDALVRVFCAAEIGAGGSLSGEGA